MTMFLVRITLRRNYRQLRLEWRLLASGSCGRRYRSHRRGPSRVHTCGVITPLLGNFKVNHVNVGKLGRHRDLTMLTVLSNSFNRTLRDRHMIEKRHVSLLPRNDHLVVLTVTMRRRHLLRLPTRVNRFRGNSNVLSVIHCRRFVPRRLSEETARRNTLLKATNARNGRRVTIVAMCRRLTTLTVRRVMKTKDIGYRVNMIQVRHVPRNNHMNSIAMFTFVFRHRRRVITFTVRLDRQYLYQKLHRHMSGTTIVRRRLKVFHERVLLRLITLYLNNGTTMGGLGGIMFT